MTEKPLPATVAGVDVELARIVVFRRLYRPATAAVFRARDDRRIDQLLDRRIELARRDTLDGSSTDA